MNDYVVQVSSVQEKVFNILRDDILNLTLCPGQVISTKNTAEKIGVSRTPVREAFLQLQQEGLIEVSLQRKTQVSRISLSGVYQEMFVREAIEIKNIRKFFDVYTDKDIEQMNRILDIQQKYLSEGDIIGCIRYDDEFHRYPFSITHEDLALELVKKHNGNYERIRYISMKNAGVVSDICEHHRQLLSSIENRDIEKFEKVLYEHFHRIEKIEKELIEQLPDYYKDSKYLVPKINGIRGNV